MRVHWMQAGELYADVRIPSDRPDLAGASSLDELSNADLCLLAKAEGFAGYTTLNGSQCTWHRAINWHGKPESLDVGDISFDADGRMIEAGVLSDYTELWERGETSESKAFEFGGDGYEGVLVSVGHRFVLGIGKRAKAPTAKLIEALSANERPHNAHELFDGIHAFGSWSGKQAIAELATQPFCEGRPVVTLTEAGVTWSKIDFFGEQTSVHMEPQALPT